MHSLRNHWSEANTGQLINQLGGIAGAIINDQKSGVPVSGGAANVANLSAQTLAALGIAQQNPQANISPPTNYTPLLLMGGGLVLVIVLIMFLKK